MCGVQIKANRGTLSEDAEHTVEARPTAERAG